MIRLRSAPLPLELPELSPSGHVDPDDDLLAAGEASDRAWWLGGRRVHADFHGLRGLTGASFGSALRVEALTWGEGAPAATWITPRAVRFERATAAGSLLETIWLPERLPGLLVEIRPVGGWVAGRTLEGELRLGLADLEAEDGVELDVAGTAEARWCGASDADGVLVAAFGGDGAVEALSEPRVDGRSVVTDLAWRPPSPDARLTLAVLAGEPAPASLRSLMVGKAHARRARPAKEALRTRLGVAEIDDAVAWAWTRMRDRIHDDLGPLPALEPAELAGWIRTALAVGLEDVARAVLPSDPRTLDEVAAWHAWASGVGTSGPLDDLEARVGAAGDRPPEVRRALAAVAERAGQDAWTAALKAAAPGTDALEAATSEPAAPEQPARERSGALPTPSVEAWRARIDDDPAALGTDGWRVLGDLVDAVLRWRPDAATGRMHLTPRLPEHWTRFVLEGLRGGELRMRLERTREGDVDTWRFAPMAGAVPATLILRIPLPDVSTPVTVDGVEAELDPERVSADEVRAPIQLQLDRERVVRVGGEPESGGRAKGGMKLPTVSPPSR